MKTELFINYFFISSILIAFLSILFFEMGRTRLSLLLLFLSSILVGIFIAKSDPFLHIWDEQFHALVAKNLIENPLKPILIKEPLFGFNPLDWSSTHIWIHKQPLFLWQMAASLKIFGLTELGVRFPSVLMHASMIFFIFRCGKIINSHNTGFYSALFYTYANFPLEYISGSYSTDHNDIAFLFYCFASLWALMEYYSSKKKRYLILIGILSGGAILCKWLTGLLVYGIWVSLIYYNRKKHLYHKELKPFLVSLLVCILVFLPWQIYCLINYPLQYTLSMNFNFKHIIQPLEGHGGSYFFYYDALYEQFGQGLLIPPLIIICFGYTIYSIKNTNSKLILLLAVCFTYLFFTFVKTKMYGYVFVSLPIFIIGLAYTTQMLAEKIGPKINSQFAKRTGLIFIMLLITFLLFDSNKIYKRHTNKESFKERRLKIKEKEMYLTLSETFKNKKFLIFNCTTSLQSHIVSMFYTGFPSFNYILPQYQIDEARVLGFKMIAIDNGNLPDYVKEDTSIVKTKF